MVEIINTREREGAEIEREVLLGKMSFVNNLFCLNNVVSLLRATPTVAE